MQMDENDELLPEYDLDFSKSKSNRFAEKYNRTQISVVLDADIAEKFPSSESVNQALRFLVRITEQHKGELTHK
jgi:hypothetical protein